jgi:hypothetical protein
MHGLRRRIPILLALLLAFQGTLLSLNCPVLSSPLQHPILDYSVCVSDPDQPPLVADGTQPAHDSRLDVAGCFDCHGLPGGPVPVPPTVGLRVAVVVRVAAVDALLLAPHAPPAAYASRAPPILA